MRHQHKQTDNQMFVIIRKLCDRVHLYGLTLTIGLFIFIWIWFDTKMLVSCWRVMLWVDIFQVCGFRTKKTADNFASIYFKISYKRTIFDYGTNYQLILKQFHWKLWSCVQQWILLPKCRYNLYQGVLLLSRSSYRLQPVIEYTWMCKTYEQKTTAIHIRWWTTNTQKKTIIRKLVQYSWNIICL